MNNRHDNILGYCFCEKCKGVEKQNILGKILMEVRNELMNKIEISFLDLNDAFRFKDSIDVELNIFKCTHNQAEVFTYSIIAAIIDYSIWDDDKKTQLLLENLYISIAEKSNIEQ